jgi:hypothetical protein
MSQILTNGLLSNQLITQGYFGREGQQIHGFVSICINSVKSSISVNGSKPIISIEGEINNANNCGT